MTTGPENPYGQNPYDPERSQGQPPPPSWPQPGQQSGQPSGQPPGQPPGQQPAQPPYGPPSGQPAPPAYGQPVQQPYQMPYGYTAPPPNEGLATPSMIIGIVSLVLACGYGVGLLGAPVALIMGRVSLKRIDRSNGTLGGRGMAQAGFILGIVGTILLVLAIIAVVVIVIVAVNGGFDDSTSYSYDTSGI